MSVDITRAPYRQLATSFVTAQLSISNMTAWTDGFSGTVQICQVLACSRHRQGDCSKQLGLWRRTHACRVPDECVGQIECHEQLTAVKTADGLKQRERKVRWCKMVPSCFTVDSAGPEASASPLLSWGRARGVREGWARGKVSGRGRRGREGARDCTPQWIFTKYQLDLAM